LSCACKAGAESADRATLICWTSNENGVLMSDNTLNKALGIMGCESPWRRRLRARLPLDRVDLAQRVGAFDDDVVEA
jgi:hypothetical protein